MNADDYYELRNFKIIIYENTVSIHISIIYKFLIYFFFLSTTNLPKVQILYYIVRSFHRIIYKFINSMGHFTKPFAGKVDGLTTYTEDPISTVFAYIVQLQYITR